MKKLALFTTVMAFTGISQVHAQKGFQVGLEVNPQLSYLSNQDDRESIYYEDKHAVNGHFGISGQYGFTDKIGIGLNVLYSFQGDKYSWKNQEFLKSLQYLKIPLVITVNLPIGTNMYFTGKAGPQLSILSSAKLYDSDKNTVRSNYMSAFNNYDFGGMISGGIAYKLNSHFIIDGAIRYDFGCINAENKDYKLNIHNPNDIVTPSPASSPRGSTYNMTVGLTFGVRYCL